MLTINNLSLSFKDKQVSNNLNLTIQKGVINGIVGLNGAGKTTLNKFSAFLHPKKTTFLNK